MSKLPFSNTFCEYMKWSKKKPATRKGYEDPVGAAGLTSPLTQWL